MFFTLYMVLHKLVYKSWLLQEVTSVYNMLASFTNHETCNPLMQKYA